MKSKCTVRIGVTTLVGFAVVLVSQLQAAAQCALCKNAIAGSPDAAKLAANFNFAILVLLIPPVLIFCGIFFAIFKLRKASGDEPLDERTSSPRPSAGLLRFHARAWNVSRPATGPKLNQDKV